MIKKTAPEVHDDPWLNLLHPYITEASHVLTASGFDVQRSWLDPRDPRDATIVISSEGEMHALVWDEVMGWRTGLFASGRPGERTTLSSTAYLGGGVLPDPREVVQNLRTGVAMPHRQFRCDTDVRDGLDDVLRGYTPRN